MIRISCKDVSAALARGEAPGVRLRLHLLICRYCRRFARQLALIARALSASVFPVPDPETTSALERAALARLRAL